MPRTRTTLSQLRVGVLAIATIAILIIFILSVTGDIAKLPTRIVDSDTLVIPSVLSVKSDSPTDAGSQP